MNTQQLIRIIVIAALLGFIALTGYVFYCCFQDQEISNAPLILVYNMLNGLVGGVFALAFGLPAPPSLQNKGRLNQKLHNLNSMMTEDDSSDKLGYFYALSYIIVGFVAVGIYIFKSEADVCYQIATNAQIFLGMMVAIVTGYFKK